MGRNNPPGSLASAPLNTKQVMCTDNQLLFLLIFLWRSSLDVAGLTPVGLDLSIGTTKKSVNQQIVHPEASRRRGIRFHPYFFFTVRRQLRFPLSAICAALFHLILLQCIVIGSQLFIVGTIWMEHRSVVQHRAKGESKEADDVL